MDNIIERAMFILNFNYDVSRESTSMRKECYGIWRTYVYTVLIYLLPLLNKSQHPRVQLTKLLSAEFTYLNLDHSYRTSNYTVCSNKFNFWEEFHSTLRNAIKECNFNNFISNSYPTAVFGSQYQSMILNESLNRLSTGLSITILFIV